MGHLSNFFQGKVFCTLDMIATGESSNKEISSYSPENCNKISNVVLTRLYVVKLNRRQKIVQMNQRLEKISKNIHIHKPWSWFGFTLCSYCPLQGSPDSIGFIYSWSGLSTLQFGFDHKIDKKEHSSPRRWKKCQEVIKSFSPPVLLKGEPNSEVNSATAICLPHKTMQTNL